MGRLCLQYALLRDADAPPGAIRRMPFTVAVTSSEEQYRRFVDAIKLTRETLSVASLSDLIATAALHRLRVVAGAASARLLALDADAQGVPDGAAQQRKQKQAQREAAEEAAEANSCLICYDEQPHCLTACCSKPFHLHPVSVGNGVRRRCQLPNVSGGDAQRATTSSRGRPSAGAGAGAGAGCGGPCGVGYR